MPTARIIHLYMYEVYNKMKGGMNWFKFNKVTMSIKSGITHMPNLVLKPAAH